MYDDYDRWRKSHFLTLNLLDIYLPCFSALWVSTSIIFDRSIGRMTLKPFPSSSSCGDCWSPNRDDLSPSIDGVIAGDEVTDSWQSNRRWRWSDESLQLYRMTRPVKCIYHIQITKEHISQSIYLERNHNFTKLTWWKFVLVRRKIWKRGTSSIFFSGLQIILNDIT